MDSILLRADRFLLRPWQRNDLPALVKYANNKKIADRLRDAFPHPYTASDGKAFIKSCMKAKPTNVFAIEIGGEAAGAIGYFRQTDVHRLNAEIGYWLGEPYWGQGITPKAIQLLAHYIFESQEILRLYAMVFGTNLASQRVLEKAGFAKEAILKNSIFKNGNLENEVVYALLKTT